jgi:hypothetical protein
MLNPLAALRETEAASGIPSENQDVPRLIE